MVRILLDKVYGQSSYSLYEEHLGENPLADMMGSAGTVAEDDLEALRRRPEPCFVKTHGYPIDDSPALCLIRDGRDALVSYAHFLRTFEPDVWSRSPYTFDEVFRTIVGSRDLYGGWTDNVLAWHERSVAAPTAWLRYEDLVEDPIGWLDAALSRLGITIPWTGSTPVPFEELHSRWPGFFRSGRAGSWQQELNEELCDLFWRHHGEQMRLFGYGLPRDDGDDVEEIGRQAVARQTDWGAESQLVRQVGERISRSRMA
jgi:sulfotransferase family protein